MDVRRILVCCLVAPAIAACGEPGEGPYDKAPGFERLCDGSEDIRFMAGIALNGNDEGDRRMLSQNGMDFFLVRGDCHYWVYGGQGMDRSYGGQLSADEESEFTDAFHYGEWQSRGIDRNWDNSDVVDGNWLVFADGAAKVGCYECRDAGGVPDVVRKMAYDHGVWFGRLQRLGKPC